MSKYKVTEKDLINKIEGFPIEVVRKMLERQVEQGNKEDVKVFQYNPLATKSHDGFDWDKTTEGGTFWYSVIASKQFDEFFARYSKNNKYVYIYQDGSKKGSDIIETLIKRGGINKIDLHGNERKSYYYIDPITKWIKRATSTSDIDILPLLKTFYTEIDVESSIKEYTMQEIADKLGINVNELRIKK